MPETPTAAELRHAAVDIARDLTTLSTSPDDVAYAAELRAQGRQMLARAAELDPPARQEN